jgi:hypothetical protein
MPVPSTKQAEHEEQPEAGRAFGVHAGADAGHFTARTRDAGAADRFPEQQCREPTQHWHWQAGVGHPTEPLPGAAGQGIDNTL